MQPQQLHIKISFHPGPRNRVIVSKQRKKYNAGRRQPRKGRKDILQRLFLILLDCSFSAFIFLPTCKRHSIMTLMSLLRGDQVWRHEFMDSPCYPSTRVVVDLKFPPTELVHPQTITCCFFFHSLPHKAMLLSKVYDAGNDFLSCNATYFSLWSFFFANLRQWFDFQSLWWTGRAIVSLHEETVLVCVQFILH